MNATMDFWKDKKNKLLRKYNNLTEKDLNYKLGEEKEMIDTLVKKLGKNKLDVLRIIITL